MNWTSGLARASALSVCFGAIAYAFHRPDLLALAAPFAVAAVSGIAMRRATPPELALSCDHLELAEGDVVTVTVEIGPSEGVELLAIALGTGGLERTEGGRASFVLALDGERHDYDIPLSLDHFGRFRLGPLLGLGFGPGAHRAVALAARGSLEVVALPVGERFRAGSLVPHARAYAGDHRSRAVTTGLDFAGIRPFAFGDSLRRINWHASARYGGLLVTSTYAERSTEVVVVIDTSYNSGPRGHTALDVAVRAATAIAEHYLAAGDLVRVAEVGPSTRSLLARGGRRQTDDVRRWLLSLDRRATGKDPSSRLGDVIVRASHPLVIVLSPLVDERTLAELAEFHRRGASIVTLDTLRAEMLAAPKGPAEEIASTLWQAERAMRLQQLSSYGVPVLPWVGGARIDAVLAQLSRLAAAPRLVRR